MRGKVLCLIFLVMVLICFVSGANAADVDSKYLSGKGVRGLTGSANVSDFPIYGSLFTP